MLPILVLPLGPPAPVSAQTLACVAPQRPMLEIELLFGRAIGSRLAVSERQWSDFLAREVTPRFPDGLTVIDARGQWRDTTSSAIVREPSKLVRLIATADASLEERIAAIVDAYKKRFHQQSVGVFTRAGCASF